MGSSPQSPSRTDLESTQKGVAVSYQAGLAGSQDATALLAFPPRKVSGWVLLLLGCTCATPHALPCPPVNGGSFLSWMMGMDSGDGDRQSRLGRPLPWMLSPGGGVSFGGASRVTREAQSGRRLLGTNGGSLWLWCCLAQPGALGP